jgi:tetratricopeptide (TPR) repeat protein
MLLMERDRLDDAIGFYRRALAAKPVFPEALNNLGNALKAQNRLAEAVDAYGEGLPQKTDFKDLLYNDALAHLKLGNMPVCWRKFESRWDTAYL